MIVKRVAGAIGAELQAVNLGDGLDAELAATCAPCSMSTRCCSFAIRTLNPPRKNTGRDFRPAADPPAYNTVEGLPEVMILESTRENPSKIEVWHSDMMFRQHPPSVTVLRGITIPR